MCAWGPDIYCMRCRGPEPFLFNDAVFLVPLQRGSIKARKVQVRRSLEGSNYKFPTGDQTCSPECDQMENFFFFCNKKVLTECILVYFNYRFQPSERQQGPEGTKSWRHRWTFGGAAAGGRKFTVSSVPCICESAESPSAPAKWRNYNKW